MPKTLRRPSLFCGLLGVAVGLVVVHTLAFTATFSAPRGIFLGFRSRAAFEIGLFLWDAIIVYGLGAGVITFSALLAAYGSFAAPTARSALFYLAGVVLAIYVLIPLAEHMPVSLALSRQWWAYGLELSLVASAFLALGVARAIAARRAKTRARPES
jgi:hypothetical protein